MICNTVNNEDIQRLNIRRILQKNPILKNRLEGSLWKDLFGDFQWKPEINRIRKVILKLAQGHVALMLSFC